MKYSSLLAVVFLSTLAIGCAKTTEAATGELFVSPIATYSVNTNNKKEVVGYGAQIKHQGFDDRALVLEYQKVDTPTRTQTYSINFQKHFGQSNIGRPFVSAGLGHQETKTGVDGPIVQVGGGYAFGKTTSPIQPKVEIRSVHRLDDIDNKKTHEVQSLAGIEIKL